MCPPVVRGWLAASAQVILVGVVGIGFVGSSLLELINRQQGLLSKKFEVHVRIIALMNADKMVLGDNCGIDLDEAQWRQAMLNSKRSASFDDFLGHMQQMQQVYPHVVVVDCSYSRRVAEEHTRWLTAGVHVITANIKALCGPLPMYYAILDKRRSVAKCYMHAVTVGGGLPIINTMHSMLSSGDSISRIEGVFSASLSFILGIVSTPAHARTGSTGGSFRAAISRAWVEGLLENDPMLDLSGRDTAEKLIVLGRELGLALQVSGSRTRASDECAKQRARRAAMTRLCLFSCHGLVTRAA